MRSNIATIKFTAIISTVFALLTYIVALNMEIAFFVPNWPWMSNSFVLTACGGVFTSTLVVMLCEIQKYMENKGNCAQHLFYQTMYLYSALFQMQKNVEEYINNQTKPVPEEALEIFTPMLQGQITAIRNVDYITFSKKNSVMKAHNNFCTRELIEIESALLYANYLKRAVITTKIDNLQHSGQQGTVTSADALVKQTLGVINGKCIHLLDDLSGHLEAMDQACNNRFKWKEIKEKIHESYISLFSTGKLEDFLAQKNA